MRRHHVRKGVLIVLGALFVAFGAGAFIGVPGGHDASHHTIGHNLTHILAGLAIISVALAGDSRDRRWFSFWFGVVYLVIGIFGVFSDRDSLRLIPGVIEFHLDDSWIQIATGLLFLALTLFRAPAGHPHAGLADAAAH